MEERFDRIIEKILLPFREEVKQKCRDSSVIGGLGHYLKSWIGRALELCPDKNCETPLRQAMSLSEGYHNARPIERKNILIQIHSLLKPLLIGKAEEKKVELQKTFPEKTPKAKEGSLKDPVEKIRGVGPKTALLLQKAGIISIEDLLFHLPRTYQDLRQIRSIREMAPGEIQSVKGRLGRIVSRRMGRGKTVTKSALSDENGSVGLVWFNQPFVEKNLRPDSLYVATGIVEHKLGAYQINSPRMREASATSEEKGRLQPVYPLTEGLGQTFFEKAIDEALKSHSHLMIETLPEKLLKKMELSGIREAIFSLHHPESLKEAEKAFLRLCFEEAFYMQLMLAVERRKIKKEGRNYFYPALKNLLSEYSKSLPFALTGCQMRVLQEIIKDMENGAPMNRLLQGDVGSGKTAVLAFGILAAAKSGFQGAVMAPTEILAEQHYYSFKNILTPLDIECGLLSGSMKPKDKENIKKRIAGGLLPVVVGTHALIQEDVEFKNLAFAVVDEQHKFGVMQRAALKEKGRGTDFLYTTATPIPRSLCLTLYGDLDVSVINELPPGRRPVKTLSIPQERIENAFALTEEELSKGGQAYIVFPAIEESEKTDLKALTTHYGEICQRFSQWPVGFIHGRLPGDEKESIMRTFADGGYKILVSTTVIEVGVDVAGATVMIIMDADHFGLSQLHQLRGRVGRAGKESLCILVYGVKSSESDRRIETLVNKSSGFEIAEEDLLIRGPGDVSGSRQSGLLPLRFLNLSADYGLIMQARQEAFLIERKDPSLEEKDHMLIKEKMLSGYKSITDIIH